MPDTIGMAEWLSASTAVPLRRDTKSHRRTSRSTAPATSKDAFYLSETHRRTRPRTLDLAVSPALDRLIARRRRSTAACRREAQS